MVFSTGCILSFGVCFVLFCFVLFCYALLCFVCLFVKMTLVGFCRYLMVQSIAEK